MNINEYDSRIKTISTKDQLHVYSDTSLKEHPGTDQGGSRARVIVVDQTPILDKSKVKLSKSFFYFLIGILGVLLLILAFLLGRQSWHPKAEAPTIIKKVIHHAPKQVIIQAPPPKPQIISVPAPQAAVKLPPLVPKVTEEKQVPPQPDIKHAATEDNEEEVRFIPQSISPGFQAEDPSISANQEKLQRYTARIDQILITSSAWQNVRLLLEDLEQGSVRGDKARILTLVKWLNQARAKVSVLEVPSLAKEHHIALLHVTGQAEAFLMELAQLVNPGHPHFVQMQTKVQSIIDQMADVEEMTISLKRN